jgi:hypothetical protein
MRNERLEILLERDMIFSTDVAAAAIRGRWRP